MSRTPGKCLTNVRNLYKSIVILERVLRHFIDLFERCIVYRALVVTYYGEYRTQHSGAFQSQPRLRRTGFRSEWNSETAVEL